MCNSAKSQVAVQRTKGLGLVACGEVGGVAGIGVLAEMALTQTR